MIKSFQNQNYSGDTGHLLTQGLTSRCQSPYVKSMIGPG